MKNKKPSKEVIVSMRKFWVPRRKELEKQCASCPFGNGNDEELANKLESIFPSHGHIAEPSVVRERVRQDVYQHAEFHCHQTVFTATGDRKPDEGHRQCPGASAFYRSGEDP